MKPFLAILGREIAERRLLFLGAAFAGLFPIVLPWLPGLSGQDPAELRGAMALGLAFITTTLLAVVLGATVIARDLSERRIGFYFARPVPGWALWAGKMLGAALLSVGAGALILLLSLPAGAKIDPTGYWGPLNIAGRAGGMYALAAFALLGILLLLAASHAVSLMVRSRSPWLAADLVALSVVATTFWITNRRLAQEGAVKILGWGGLGWTVLVLCAVSLAGLVQVTRGRTDLRRGHRLLSLTLWALVIAATLGHAAYARWALRVTPEDLVSISGVSPAPSGSWIAVSGPARGRGGYAPTFLLDVGSEGSERSIKLPGFGLPYWWRPPLFSQDGGRAFWLESMGGNSFQILALDLRHPEPVPRRTGLIYSDYFGIEPSPDGHRIAALARGRLTVDDLDTGRMLASVPMESRPFVLFLENDRVRIFLASHEEEPGMPEVWRWRTFDLDVASNRLLPVSRIELPGDSWMSVVSPDGRRAVLWHSTSREAWLADLETGRTSPLPALHDPISLRILSDGRIAFRPKEEPRSLRLLTPDGAERLRVQLPGPRLKIGSLVAPDRLILATSSRSSAREIEAWTSWLLDLQTGRLQALGSGMVPAVGYVEPGSPASRLFLRGGRGLALLDPATGRLRTLLQGKPVEPGL